LALHVRLVAALFVLWGALTIVIGLSTLALGMGAVAFIASSDTNQVVASLTAAAFTGLGAAAIVWGAIHVGVGASLRRLGPRARLAALMLGTVDVLLLPYGTALGVYTLWVLLNESAKRHFEGTLLSTS
jgi:hypothetical protein